MPRKIDWPLVGGTILAGGILGLFAKAAFGASVPGVSKAHDLPSLRPEYAAMFDAAQIRPERLASVDRVVEMLTSNRARYEAVQASTGVPWYAVAAIHSLEGGGSSGRFTGHLHNGDSLNAQTVHVPANRPVAPPANGVAYTWEESADDALSRWNGVTDWSVPAMLWRLESYNGWGYRNRGLPTPYLWSGTDRYERGKYVSDGNFDPNAVSSQIGAAAIIKRMAQRGIIAPPG